MGLSPDNGQIDLCELLGSGKRPENGTISRYRPASE